MTPANILSLTTEAAVLIEKNRISYANPGALELLGKDCIGKTLLSVFGPDLAGTQASAFVGDVPINGKPYIVRVNKLEAGQIIFISSAETSPVVFNDAIIFSALSTLNNINAASDKGRLQAEKLDDKTILSSFEVLTRSCHSLNRLMNNVGIVRNLAEGKLHTEPQIIDLSWLYSSLLDTVSKLYPGDIFKLNMGKGISAAVDYTLAVQLLLNLVSNCLLHAEGCTKISVSLTETEESVVLSVSDNGCGIAPDELHSVFDRYRHSFSSMQMGKGAGLGLAVARGAAEIHGGTLLMESRLGQGTCVRVSLRKNSDKKLRLGAALEDYGSQMRSILTGLADCLPQECFSEKFTD